MLDTAEADAWAKLSLEGLRHCHDRDLEAEVAWARRELAELKLGGDVPGLYQAVLKRRIALTEMEQARRRMLSERGGGPLAKLPSDFPRRIERAKAGIDIRGIADLLDIPTEALAHNGRLRFRCPIHGDGSDRNPSGLLYLDEWRYWCFGCNAGGSGFDLVVAFGQANTFIAALEWIEKFLPPLPTKRPAGSGPGPLDGIIPDR